VAKEPEKITVAGFDWVRSDPPSGSHAERWLVVLPGVRVYVSNYGAEDRRGDNFKGWRVVVGAPGSDEYGSRDEAMEAAHKQIENESRNRLAAIRREVESGHDLVRLCKLGGIELERKPDAGRQAELR
jgi:hypothetical protein